MLPPPAALGILCSDKCVVPSAKSLGPRERLEESRVFKPTLAGTALQEWEPGNAGLGSRVQTQQPSHNNLSGLQINFQDYL